MADQARSNGAERVGVYVCHCGSNIAATVDVEEVARWAGTLPGVAVARDYKFLCSSLGQGMIAEDIQKEKLTRVVVAACSPHLHEKTFRRACANAGLNPFLLQMTNIREHVSWVTKDKPAATAKAKALVAGAVARVQHQQPLEPTPVPVNKHTLVLGGGIAGIQAALELADAGYPVYLVEREPSIGGHMAQFDKTFPTLDCAACILTPKMSDIAQHDQITLWTYSELESLSGSIGNFQARIRRKARYVDEDKCTGCGRCVERCPVQFKPVDATFHPKIDLPPEMKMVVHRAVNLHRHERGPLVSILQDINIDLGYLPADALRYVSQRLQIPLSRVYHVATFYTAFSLTPRGKHILKVCVGTACHVCGSARLLETLEQRLEIRAGDTTKDMQFTVETVNCLGACAMGPLLVVDEEYVTARPKDVDRLVANLSR